jgi:hypothetical protein
MEHQLFLELLESEVQRSPRDARVGRRREVGGEPPEGLQSARVFLVLHLHHVHRSGSDTSLTVRDEWKQHLLFLREVFEHGLVHCDQMRRQTPRAARLVGMPHFDLRRHANQLRQRLPQPAVVGVDDEGHQLGERPDVPALVVVGEALFGLDVGNDCRAVEPAFSANIGERASAPTTEVEAVAIEDTRRCRWVVARSASVVEEVIMPMCWASPVPP